MKKKCILVLFSIMLISLLTGCLQFRPVKPLSTSNLDKEFQMGKYVPKVENFIIILDSSSSMSVTYKGKADLGYSKFRVAKDMVIQMIHIMPEMKINGAIQTFGRWNLEPAMQTETVYGLTTFSRSDLKKNLNSIKSPAEGNSPAGLAIEAINGVLSTTQGKCAVILISDGEYLENEPLTKIRDLEERNGDRICFYTIWVGNKPEGKIFMEKLAGGMGCGSSTSVDEIAHRGDMTDFVIKVFLATSDIDSDKDGVLDNLDRCPDTPIGVEVDESGCPEVSRIDSDNDGVLDDSDRCPGTPIGVAVDESGCPKVSRLDSDGDGVLDDSDKCPGTSTGIAVDESGCPKVNRLDSDKDGVLDSHDKCPDTPMGVVVDESGCPEVSRIDSDGDGVYDDADDCPDTPRGAIVDSRGCWIVRGVKFEYKKWDVHPQFNSNLDNVVKILKENPGLNIRIEGHTDDIGSMKYNLRLSSRRAQSIKEYLVNEGINPSRITSTGLGYSQPIVSNDTPEGRALNRRAEIIPVK